MPGLQGAHPLALPARGASGLRRFLRIVADGTRGILWHPDREFRRARRTHRRHIRRFRSVRDPGSGLDRRDVGGAHRVLARSGAPRERARGPRHGRQRAGRLRGRARGVLRRHGARRGLLVTVGWLGFEGLRAVDRWDSGTSS